MSFNAQDFSVMAYANGFTHWHYRTRDPLALLFADYFAGAAELLRAGDQITVTLLAGNRADLVLLAVIGLPATTSESTPETTGESTAPQVVMLAGSTQAHTPTHAPVQTFATAA